MRIARAQLVVALVVTTTVAAPAAAQTAVSSFAELQGRLEADQTVYVQTAEVADEHGRGIKGRVVELSDSTLRLLVRGEFREFSERDVLFVSERHTSQARGALIGLAVGSGFGLWGWSAVGGCGSTESCAYAKLFLGLGAGAGAIVGREIGRSLVHEQVLFRAPDLTSSRTFAMMPFVDAGRKGLAATIRF
jgi:hypothetical protein